MDRRYFRDSRGEIDPACDITVPGFGATMSDVNSYIGILQMNEIELLIGKQRNNAMFWDRLLSEEYGKYILMNQRKEINPNYWIYGILTQNKNETLDTFRKSGYSASGVHLPNCYYSIFGKQQSLPGVDKFYSQFLAIPSGWWFENNNKA